MSGSVATQGPEEQDAPDVYNQDDLDARDEIDASTAAAATAAVTTADGWLKGVGALTGLLATVAIVKGPTDASKVPDNVLPFVLLGMGVGFFALALSMCLLYAAAHGKPGQLNRIKPSPINGLALRLATARANTAKTVLDRIRVGMIRAVIGLLALFVSSILTVLPLGEAEGGGGDTVCVTVDGTQVLEVSGDSLDVANSASGVAIGKC